MYSYLFCIGILLHSFGRTWSIALLKKYVYTGHYGKSLSILTYKDRLVLSLLWNQFKLCSVQHNFLNHSCDSNFKDGFISIKYFSHLHAASSISTEVASVKLMTWHEWRPIQMWCVTQFSTICTIYKTWKHPWRSATFSKVPGF